MTNRRKKKSQCPSIKEPSTMNTPPKRRIPIIEFPMQETAIPVWGKWSIGCVFFAIFFIFVATLSPDIATGDSSELVTSAYLLGIPHPPGYPLFNLLGQLFTWLPIGSIAWRVNLSSSICNLGAGFFIYLTTYKITKHWLSSLFAAVFFVLSPLVWEYSLKAEVFPLNNLLAALILYLLMVMRQGYLETVDQLNKNDSHQNNRYILYVISFVCGLALTNHHTIVLFFPAVMVGVYYYSRLYLSEFRTVLIGLSAFFMGLSIYLYVPIRAATDPYLNWDAPNNMAGFIQLISRADYGSLTLLNLKTSTYSLTEKYSIYLLSLLKQVNPLGVVLACIGLFFLLRQKDKKLTISLLLIYVVSSFIFFMIANFPSTSPIFLGVFERFYMLSTILVAVFIGLGIYFLHCLILKTARKNWIYFINALIGASIITSVIVHFPILNQHNNRLLYHYGLNILKSVEPNALILVSGDNTIGALDALGQVNKIRPDVVTLNIEKLSYPWYCGQMTKRYPSVSIPLEVFHYHQFNEFMQLIEKNINQHPIYVVSLPNEYVGLLQSQYKLIPIGLVQKIVKKDDLLQVENYIKNNERLWKSYDLLELDRSYPATAMESIIVGLYACSHFNLAWEYHQRGLFDLAIHEYDLARHVNPRFPDPYKNLGIIYQFTKHQPFKAASLWRTYLHLNPFDKERDQLIAFINDHSPHEKAIRLPTKTYPTPEVMALLKPIK